MRLFLSINMLIINMIQTRIIKLSTNYAYKLLHTKWQYKKIPRNFADPNALYKLSLVTSICS